ncbi:diguanylate cyclase [Octadecabacter temperatus]|uniref:diguanylate cyclase n=1 Tax=Octadecabacter temperatus TaxID=1458307 RepID=A0A0K0Y514_9RHOB|nr:diguanylate cyclase [Octadecabacter temperatus]AKS46030.1 putative diguanylate cyclase YegE [Octadecabacter temperatus]SIO06038.1 diguanylate cyclase [Octadecabacter temperatus]
MIELLFNAHIVVDPIALILALILIVSIVKRKKQSEWKSRLVMAGLFSFTLMLSMSNPIDLGEGGIHDMRGLLIGVAVALLGPTVGLLTLATGLAMRLGIGGPGLAPGLVAMFAAFGGGLVWRYKFYDSEHAVWIKSVILGCLISFHLVGLTLFPADLALHLFLVMGPYYIAGNIIGALVINYLLGGELSFLSEAQALEIDANTDHLTGLLNRRGLESALPNLKTKFAPKKGRALLYFDIDNFKTSNDKYGHAFGDDLLVGISERISMNLRRHDVFARMGGDEFAVILPEVDIEEARFVAERCRSVVGDEGFFYGEQKVPVTLSIGAVWLDEPSEMNAMILAADRAMYHAKVSGRNVVVFLENHSNSTLKRPIQNMQQVA